MRRITSRDVVGYDPVCFLNLPRCGNAKPIVSPGFNPLCKVITTRRDFVINHLRAPNIPGLQFFINESPEGVETAGGFISPRWPYLGRISRAFGQTMNSRANALAQAKGAPVTEGDVAVTRYRVPQAQRVGGQLLTPAEVIESGAATPGRDFPQVGMGREITKPASRVRNIGEYELLGYRPSPVSVKGAKQAYPRASRGFIESRALQDDIRQIKQEQVLRDALRSAQGQPPLKTYQRSRITPDQIGELFDDPLMRQFEKDVIQREATRHGLKATATRAEGLWRGSPEPSWIVEAKGNAHDIIRYAGQAGVKGDQQAVAVFLKDANGPDARYVISGIKNRPLAARLLKAAGQDGATFVGDKAIIFDKGGKRINRIAQMAQKRGLSVSAPERGQFKLLFQDDFDNALQEISDFRTKGTIVVLGPQVGKRAVVE
jgi:hypothetical protein